MKCNMNQNLQNQMEKGQQCVNHLVTLDTNICASSIQMQTNQLPKIPLWTVEPQLILSRAQTSIKLALKQMSAFHQLITLQSSLVHTIIKSHNTLSQSSWPCTDHLNNPI